MKKFLKYITIIILIIIILFSIFALGLFLIMNYMKKNSDSQRYYDKGIDIIQNEDYIVVPGAKINLNTSGDYLQHRLDYAYQLYKNKKAPIIIIFFYS